MANIFIVTDPMQADVLDPAAEGIRQSGHRVTRGPANIVGERRTYTDEECSRLITPADVIVFTNRHDASRNLLSAGHRLRGVCYPVTGTESLDLSAASDLGLIVGHGRLRENAVGMAEATILLMLMLLYNAQPTIGLIRAKGWARPPERPRSLDGKTIGIVGFGRIGRDVAERITAFGVRILAVSPRARQEDFPAYVTKVDLGTALRESDVVIVLAGLTPETQGMIGEAELALMKSDAYLVNTGRGAVIDESALCRALAEGRIAGAALDTFSVEPLPLDSPLRTLENVILTPHCIGHTQEGISGFAPALIENVNRIARGELPLYCLNPEVEDRWRNRLRQLAD